MKDKWLKFMKALIFKSFYVISLLFAVGLALGTPVKFWWTGDLTQNGQMTIYNPSAQDGDTGIPVASADIDNDGKMDALLSAITGDGRLNNKTSCGELHVLFGVDSIRGEIDLALYNGVYENLFTLWGRSTKDYLGAKSSAGDLDGDGTKDLVVGASWCDNLMGREDGGEVYIVWGGGHLRNSFADLAVPADVNELQITFIIGAEEDDKLGVWHSEGDVNGDDFLDLLIGAPRANGYNNDEDQTGEAYLLYGPFSRSDTIDLANTAHPMTVIFGRDSADQMGNTLELADLNGDGFDDVIISASAQQVARLGDTDDDYPFETGGAGDGPNNDRPAAGEAYILWGSAAFDNNDTINLAPGFPPGTTVIYGAHGIENDGEVGGDEFAEEMSVADVNGDGIKDLLCGAFRADGLNNDITWAGNNYLFYGRHNWPTYIDLADGLPDSTTAIYGGGIDWLTGDSTPLGDVNGDGFFDILGGCVHGSGTYDIYKSGTIRIIFGKEELLPPVIDFADPPDTLYAPLIQGAEVSDLMSYWGTTGDFNGDGYWDVITNVMHGDGPNNSRHNAGDFYIISGEWIWEHPGQPRFLNSDNDSARVVLSWHDNEERGQDWHIIYRSTDGGQNYDSVGFVPHAVHTYIDSAVTAGETYTYRVVAVGVNTMRSNPSYPLSVFVGGSVGDGLPLIVNGIHWQTYGAEAFNFYDDEILLDGEAYDFWDLYSTNNYPDDIEPIGFGKDSLAEKLFEHPLILWMANNFDPDTSYDDGEILFDMGPTLVSYLQSGGQLVIIGKELAACLSPDLQLAFAHTVNWGFQVTVTNTQFLTNHYWGVGDIRRSGQNAANLTPFSVDNSGCSLLLHSFADDETEEDNYNEDDYTWMSEISRGSVLDPYNFAMMSMRQYRANQNDLRSFMQTLLGDLLDHYPAPTGVVAIASGPNEIMICWDDPIYPNVSGHCVMRTRHDGSGGNDTLGFVPAGTNQFFDSPPDPFAEYDYWVISMHTDGRRSLDSWPRATGFSPPSITPGTLLIINGIDWDTYGAEATNLYANHVLQGDREFRFWDIFTEPNYPAGYVPLGHGTNGLTAEIWQAATTLWVFNGFNGDEDAFLEVQPMLDTYVDFGGNLLIVGKELNLYLSSDLQNRLGLDQWELTSDWTASDEAWGEHPSLATFGKNGAVNMSLIPEFTLDQNANVYPLYRRSGMNDQYLAAVSRDDESSPFNFGIFSIRPYRAEPAAFALAMDEILDSFVGDTLRNPVNGLTIYPDSAQPGTVTLRWPAVPGATAYRVCKRTIQNEPMREETVIGMPTATTFTDGPVVDGLVRYSVFPVFENEQEILLKRKQTIGSR